MDLQQEKGAILQQRPVRLAHRLHDGHRVGVLARRRGLPAERAQNALEAATDGGDEQLLLCPEQLEQVGLGDADPFGDGLDGGAVEAALGELRHGRLEDRLASLLLAEPGGRGRRGHVG